MMTSTGALKSRNEMLGALRTARDTVRVQVHLLSLETKQQWLDLENKLEAMETRLHQASDSGLEAAADGVASKVRELLSHVGSFLREGLPPTPLNTPVKFLLGARPQTCSPKDSLAQVAKLLWENDCGALPVTNSAGEVVGMITDRDLCMAAYTRGVPLHAIDVTTTMSTDVQVIDANATLGDLMQLLGRYQLRRAPIVENGRLVGVLSQADLSREAARVLGQDPTFALTLIRALAQISSATKSSPASLN